MLQFSLPLGRWFGVPIRAHLSLFLLLALATGYSAVVTGGLARGFALWSALLAAVLVREIARAIAAAYLDLPLRALFLLPVGGIMAFAPRQGVLTGTGTRRMTLVGSAANFGAGLLLFAFAYGIDPHVRLLSQPWIAIGHILRSAVWLQMLVGVVNLLPSSALPLRRLARFTAAGTPPETAGGVLRPGVPRPRAVFSVWMAAAMALVLAGVLAGMLWPVLLGMTVLLLLYTNRAASSGSMDGLGLSVSDVMLTDFKPLSASSTLRDALRQTTHTVQELFPVLRGERLVGWISRTALTARLRVEGDGFLQGAMVRSLQAVTPSEPVGEALRRASALGGGTFIPVVEDGAMVGILTLKGLERAMAQRQLTRPPVESDAR